MTKTDLINEITNAMQVSAQAWKQLHEGADTSRISLEIAELSMILGNLLHELNEEGEA